MSGEAMAMRLELAKLGLRHGVAHRPHIIPLADPIDGPVVVEGLASTSNVDLEFTRFRPWAFNNPCLLLSSYALPPLLYKHRDGEIAGTIEGLSYDDRGNVKIRASVDHEKAKRCGGLSIRAKINAFELRDIESKNFHALVSDAEIIEVSLTDRPANPAAIVHSRYAAPPVEAYLNAMGDTDALLTRGVKVIQRQIQLLQQLAKTPTPTPPPPARSRSPIRRASVVSAPRRPTQFSQLVQAINHAQH